MKRAILFSALIFGIVINSVAQQTPLKGVVTVQNSKTNTGKIQYVKNAEVTHPKAKSEVTDDDGKFTLNITGLHPNSQTQITVTPHGEYAEYVIVNAKELLDITLGRVTPVGVFICKKGDLEQRQAEMIGINMRKLEERMEADKKRLQKELDALKQNNDYLNTRYSEIKDSLDIISKNIDKAFERIKEYAKTMVLENLDFKDDNYVKAYHCFARGELDSVSYYLQDEELELKHQKIIQLQEEAKKEKELASILTESAKAKEEFSENSLSQLIKEWLLLARTYNMKNDYEKTMLYYEKALHADSLNTDNLYEYANYLYSIRDYNKAENYYLQCLERYRALEKENPKTYLSGLANTLNSLAVLHKVNNEYSKALEEYEEALEISKGVTKENPKEEHVADLARILNNFGSLYLATKEYSKASEKYEEALEIRRKLAEKNAKDYLLDLSVTLNNFGNIHHFTKEYSQALEKFEEALGISRKLAEDNPKIYLSYIATILSNLANIHTNTGNYPKALEEYEEALEIRRELAAENPKAYLPDVATTLINLSFLLGTINEISKALEEGKAALKIFERLAAENPRAYAPYVVFVLNNLSGYSFLTKEFEQSEQYVRKALQLDSSNVTSKSNLAHALLFQNRYSEAEEIYKELSQPNAETGRAPSLLLSDLDELEQSGVIPEERKEDVAKIREILENIED